MLRPGLHALPAVPWSEEYQVAYLDMNHRVFDRIDAVVGEHVWNFADFTTISGTARVGGNKKGAFTRDRQPKAAAAAPVPASPRGAAQPAPADEAGQ